MTFRLAYRSDAPSSPTFRKLRQIGQEHLISIRGAYTHKSIGNQGVGGLNLPDVAANFDDREDLVALNYRSPITKKLFNLFRFYAARQHTPTTSVNPDPKITIGP